MTELEKLIQAIAAIEAQRAILGDTVVEAALGPMREKLAQLSPQPFPVEGHRKLITVLFADISGFTALSEHLDAEDLLETINALWQQIDETIVAHGGRVDKHYGDGLMALWSAGEAREDDAERAIRAALSMQSILALLNAQVSGNPEAAGPVRPDAPPRLRFQLRMRIGLHTGPSMIGTVGATRELTAMGDAVNLASRLEHAAPIDGILISHDTYRQVRGVFDVSLQLPLSVKGKSEPVQTYIVLRAKPRAFRLYSRGVEGLETHQVGRAAEMEQLQTAFETCISQHKTRLITVVGEAGLGKTRLMQEFLAWTELAPTTYILFHARATPGEVDSPYALLRDMLAYRFEILESDSLPVARAKLEKGFVDWLPGDPQAQEKAHFIGHLLGWDFSASPYIRGLLGDAVQIRTLAVHFLMLFFSTVARAYPVIMLLEDLHWADRGSLDVLRSVLGNLPPASPILAIINTRPTLFERYPAWKLAAQTRIDLIPLDPGESTALVADILRYMPDIPASLLGRIVDQAEGNPFYLEELIKMLIDEKVILTGPTQWQVTPERLSNLRIPSTLVGILQVRLDSLPPTERLALQQAAIIGRTFWDSAVQSLDPTQPELHSLHDILDAIERRELLSRSPESVFAGTREYRFRHALLHDVAYETVLKRDRPAYHARAAAWLESICGARRSEYLPLLAEHTQKAGSIPEAAGLWREAGERALQLSAFAECADFYRRALALTPAVSALLCRQGEAYYNLGEIPSAELALQEALATATTREDRIAVLAQSSEVATGLGEYYRAFDLLTEALALARESGDPVLLSRALFGLGDVNWRLGKLEEARQALQESASLSEAAGETSQLLYTLNRLGVVLGHFDLTAGDRVHLEVLPRAMALGNRNLVLMVLNNLGETAKARLDFASAHTYHERALALAQDIGAQRFIGLVLLNLAVDDIALGQLSHARKRLREGMGLAVRLGLTTITGPGVMYFGHLAQAEGDIGRALELWGVAQHHPAWSSDNQYELDQMLDRLALDPQHVQAGLARGAALDWDATVKALLDK